MNVPGEEYGSAMSETPAMCGRFVRSVALPTLQEMASTRVALAIWYRYLSSHMKPIELREESRDILMETLGIDETYDEDCPKMVESLKTPQSIEATLKSALRFVRDETRSWILHFKCYTFSENMLEYRIQHFDPSWCFWLANGTIDYAKTASKILSVGRFELNLMQEFAIMSLFCMQDKIKEFPWQLLPRNFVDDANIDRDYLLFYWICYLKKELNKIPTANRQSVDEFMALKCTKYQRAAFEYFFNRLGEEDQLKVAEVKFNIYKSQIDQERILSMLSQHQQLRLLSKLSAANLLNFWSRLKSFESQVLIATALLDPSLKEDERQKPFFCEFSSSHRSELLSRKPAIYILTLWIPLNQPDSAFTAWQSAKDQVSKGQFSHLVETMLIKKMNSEKDMKLLLDLWNSAPQNLRNHMVERSGDSIMNAFVANSDHSASALTFLNHYLSLKSLQSRRDLLERNLHHLPVNFAHSASFVETLKLCWPDDQDRLEMQTKVMNLPTTLSQAVQLTNRGRFDDLSLMLKIYSPNKNASVEFLKRVLTSNELYRHRCCLRFNLWSKLSEFIDSVCTYETEAALDIKKHTISTFVADCLCSCDWNYEKRLNQFQKIVESVFTVEEEKELKQTLLNGFRKTIATTSYWDTFEARYLVEFLAWCFDGDAEKIEEFKARIPFDEIFDSVIKNVHGDRYDTLDGLNRGLSWYFAEDDAAKAYKMRKMYEFDVDLMVEKLPPYPSKVWREMMHRVFDGDQDEIRKFGLRQLKRDCEKKGMKVQID